jgi:hypothetical protein
MNTGLERGRRQVHAAFQHRVEEAVERGAVAGHGLRIGVDADVAALKNRPNMPPTRCVVNAIPAARRRGFQPIAQRVRLRFECVVRNRAPASAPASPGPPPSPPDCRSACRPGRSGRSARSVASVRAAAVGAHRHAAADDLAEGRQVRASRRTRPARRRARRGSRSSLRRRSARRRVGCTGRAGAADNPRGGRMQLALPTTGSTIRQAMSLRRIARTTALRRIEIVVGQGQGQVGQCGGTPGEVGTPKVSAPEPAFTRKASPWP